MVNIEQIKPHYDIFVNINGTDENGHILTWIFPKGSSGLLASTLKGID